MRPGACLGAVLGLTLANLLRAPTPVRRGGDVRHQLRPLLADVSAMRQWRAKRPKPDAVAREEPEELMRDAEAAFARGDLERAEWLLQKAGDLEADRRGEPPQ